MSASTNSEEKHPFSNIDKIKRQLNINDEYINKENLQEGGIWFPDTKRIICGTFPPKKEYFNRKGYFYYSSTRNQFWKHIDSIYKTSLFASKVIADSCEMRISNSLMKVEFCKTKKIGFIDIFTIVKRRVEGSSKDEDLIKVETIFDNGIFDKILNSNVNVLIFVYDLSKQTFENNIYLQYKITPKLIRMYKTDNQLYSIETINVNNKEIFLIYAPIHGKNAWDMKQIALSSAIEYVAN